MENRREHKRFKLHQMVEISISGEENMISILSIDISLTGMQCQLNSPIKSGADIYIMLEIPLGGESYLLKCYGDIIRQEKYSDYYAVGIKFKHIYEKDRDVLLQYLNNC